MLWRRVIALGLLGLLLVGLIPCLLIGCRLFQTMDGPDMEYHGEETAQEEVGCADSDKSDTAEAETVKRH